MGTSQSYSIKPSPNWTKTKRAITHLAKPGNMNQANVENFLGNFSRAVSENNVFGRAGGTAIGNFLQFITNIQNKGWELAIQELAPQQEIGHLTLIEFLELLLELFCKNDSDMDDQAANIAFQELEGYIMTQLESVEDLSGLLANATEEQMLEWVGYFYTNYIMQIFGELYYTHLEEKESVPEDVLNGIRDYVETSVNEVLLNKPDDFNIFSDQGKAFVNGIIDELKDIWEQL